MLKHRFSIISAVGGLAGSVLAVSVSAQPPAPVPPSGPAPPVSYERVGPVRRAFHHTFGVLQDNLIGYPNTFVEPPLGFHVNEAMGVMRAKADPHRFTVYQSDFLAGTTSLSPVGAGRFNLMVSRLGGWLGPVLVEWSPDQPGLAESRREAVLAMLQSTGLTVIPERVVIGPSPYPGLYGNYAAGMMTTLFTRDVQAPATYSLTPVTPGGSFNTGGGGSN